MAEESLQKRLLDYHDKILFVSDETGSAESSLSKSQYAAAAECSLPMTQGAVQSSFDMTLGATQSSLAITQGAAVAECSLPVAQGVAAAEYSFSMIKKVNNGSPEMLKNKLQSLLLVVDDAEEKQYRSKVVKEWLDKLQDVVYDKEDLIDEIHTEGFQHRLDEILDRVESLAKRKDELGLKKRIEHNMEKSLRMPAASFGDDNSKVIYGRESDKKEIIDLLLSNDANGRKLSVISLLANDGMGKTTLARLIYKDHRVTEHFDLKAWAYVSDLSDTFMVTKAVFE
ncbi:putative disease resistance RPP13-like protein 1 [Quercus suber]|uniref:putative disease resistance RPP13-like protein 1 n=1 Tax=Quercus suber TaxID=58331 RepID=UPI0032DF8D26